MDQSLYHNVGYLLAYQYLEKLLWMTGPYQNLWLLLIL